MRHIIYGLATALLLTACMGGEDGLVSYHRVGVVHDSPMRCIYTTDDQGQIYVISSADFEQNSDAKDGDCCSVDFETNFSEQLTAGVYNVDLFSYDSVQLWTITELLDTTTLIEGERLMTLDFSKSLYLEGRFFLQTQHKNHQDDQIARFYLTYDPDQDLDDDEDGRRIYDFYIRVTQEGGTGDSSTYIKTSAFLLEDFVANARTAETAAGKDSLHIRLNYASSYNADTTACIWAATKTFSMSLSE